MKALLVIQFIIIFNLIMILELSFALGSPMILEIGIEPII